MNHSSYACKHPDFSEALGEAQHRTNVLLAQLIEAPDRNRRRTLMRRILSDEPKVRLHFSYQGVKKARKLAEYSPDQIREIAEGLNVYAPLAEPVDTHVVRKRNRDRLVLKFRPQSRARQLMVAAVLQAIHGPFPCQFGIAGGMPAALKVVEQAVRDGYCFAIEVDVCNFYPSVQLEQLLAVLHPLPRAVGRNVVWIDDNIHINAPHGSLWGHDDPIYARGQRGLPLGSACSPVAAEKLMSDVLTALPGWSAP